jgi:hypothetical protein
MPAGHGTRHAGYGNCSSHGGSGKNVEEGWAMAMQVAAEYGINPWEALLLSVRLAAGRVAWVDQQLTESTRAADGDVANDKVVQRWLKESRFERTLLARTAKAAIDAGVAERMVRQVELEGRLLAEALGHALDAIELTPEQRLAAMDAAHNYLLPGSDADRIAPAVIEGEVLPSHVTGEPEPDEPPAAEPAPDPELPPDPPQESPGGIPPPFDPTDPFA